MTSLNLDRLKARVATAISHRFPRTRVLISPSADDSTCLNVLVLNAERTDVLAIKQMVRMLDDEAELLGLSLVPIVKDREITARYYPGNRPGTFRPTTLLDYFQTELQELEALGWKQMDTPEGAERVAEGGGRCFAGWTAFQTATSRDIDGEFPEWMLNLDWSIQAGESLEAQPGAPTGMEWDSACDGYGCAIGGVDPSHEELALAA